MDTTFIVRPQELPSSLPNHRPLPVPITPSHGLHTPPFTPQSAPLSNASFPSFFVNVRGRTAESAKGSDHQVSPVSAPGSFIFRTPFSNRRTIQSSQPSSFGDSVTDSSYSSHSATPSDCDDFEMDLNAVMLSDDSSQQQVMTGYGGIQPNESALRTESRSPPYPADADSPHKEDYSDQQPQQGLHQTFLTPSSTQHDSQRSMHHAGSFHHPILMPIQTSNEQYHTEQQQQQQQQAHNSPYGHSHQLSSSMPSHEYCPTSVVSQGGTYIQMPPPPGLSASLQGSSISSTSSPISMGTWVEAPQIAPLNLPRNHAEMDSATPKSSESFASQQAMWSPATTYYSQNPNYAPAPYMMAPPGYRSVYPPQGMTLPSMQQQQVYHPQPVYGSWGTPPSNAGTARSIRGIGSGMMVRPSAAMGAKSSIHCGHDDNPAVSSKVPAYVNAVVINVSPKVIEAFERHHDPNDPFAPQALTRPPTAYAALIGQAILAAEPPKRLLISDIFSRIVDRYPFYAANPRLLYNGIRHAMTISEAFEKIPREWGDQSGKARKWGIKPGYESWFEGGGYAKGGPNAPKPVPANKKKQNVRPPKSKDEGDEEQELVHYENQGYDTYPENAPAPARGGNKRGAGITSRQPTATTATSTSVIESVRQGARSSARLKRNVTSPSSLPTTDKWIPAESQQPAGFAMRGSGSPTRLFRTVSDGDISNGQGHGQGY